MRNAENALSCLFAWVDVPIVLYQEAVNNAFQSNTTTRD